MTYNLCLVACRQTCCFSYGMWHLEFVLLCLIYLTAASNSTVPTVSLTTEAPPTHNECVDECLPALLRLNQQEDYHQCMHNCLGEWLLSYEGDCMLGMSDTDTNGLTCDPKNIGVAELSQIDPATNETFGYLAISWNPCPAGIEDATGFQVYLQAVAAGAFPECQRLRLTRKLTIKDMNTRFTIIALPKAVNSAEYDLQVRSLPMASLDANFLTVFALSCKDLNDDHYCYCQPPITAPKVVVSGYKVVATTYPRIECHPIKTYEFMIFSTQASESVDFKFVNANADEKEVSATFDNVYDSPEPLIASMTLSYNDDVYETKSTTVVVKAWEPPLSNVTVHSRNHIEVSFPLAPGNFTVPMYILRLSQHFSNASNRGGGVNETLAIEVVSDTQLYSKWAKSGVLTKKYLQLQPGKYSVQIRESRPKSQYFNSPKWGKRRYFVVESPPITLAFIIVPVILCLVITAVVALLVMWKRNNCQRIRYLIPSGIVSLLDTQTVSMTTKSIFLVWQADLRSRKLFALQADVVRHLATYLGKVCSLDVTVDIFSETEASRSMSAWTRNAVKKCDFVLFLCPHFDNKSNPKVVPSKLGDFHAIFSYLESDLTNKEKFITAFLPYSDQTLSSSEILIRMSTVFSLMDDISGLFFHIQGISRAMASGVNNAQFVNAEDYKETKEGAALARGIKIFQEALSSWTENPSSLDSLEMSEGSKDGCSVFFSTDGSEKSLVRSESPKTTKTKALPFAPLVNDDDDSDDAPLMVRSLQGVVRPPSPNSVINQRTDHVYPPSAFVADPDFAIQQINNHSAEMKLGKKNTNSSSFILPGSDSNSSQPRSSAELHCSSQSQEVVMNPLEKSDTQSPEFMGSLSADLQPNKPRSDNLVADSGFDSITA